MIDVMKRLAELDSQNPNIVKENLGLDECGPMGMMGGMDKPSTPATINMTAGSGEELSDMLGAIMKLAGVHSVEPHHMGMEPEPMTLTAEPVAAVGPAASAGDEMRSVIDKMHDAGGDEEGDEHEEETDEGMDEYGIPGVATTPKSPHAHKAFDVEEFSHHENQPGSGKTSNDEKRQSNLPTATYESLMADYKKFVAENMDQMDDDEIDKFVNGNQPNFKGRYNDDFDKAQQMFASFLKKKGKAVDSIDDDAYPVLVAMCQGQPCAWYDLENAQGFVGATSMMESQKKKIDERMGDSVEITLTFAEGPPKQDHIVDGDDTSMMSMQQLIQHFSEKYKKPVVGITIDTTPTPYREPAGRVHHEPYEEPSSPDRYTHRTGADTPYR